MVDTIFCAECGSEMVLRETSKFLQNGKPRKFYGCSSYPLCKGTHGAHPDGSPLGVPGNIETKKARMLAHSVFDNWWKMEGFKRQEGYDQISKAFGFRIHIAESDIECCNKIITFCLNERLAR